MRPRFRPNRVALAVYAGFIALSAYFGSVGMISGLLPVGGSLAERLPWHSPAFAGIALALVGLPASVVAVLSWRRHPRTADAAALAGLLLVFVHLHESSLRDPRIPRGVFGVYSCYSSRPPAVRRVVWRYQWTGPRRGRAIGPGHDRPIAPASRAPVATMLGLFRSLGQAREGRQPMTFPRALARYTRGAVNKMTLHLAGHAALADLEHTGRKSGTVRYTPVRAFRAGDTVVVGLNFGRQSDWYQNIKAAGTCRMRLGGEQLTLGAPALVPAAQGVTDLPWLFRFALRHVVHTADCVQLPILRTSRTPVARR
jgi:deazaflavin-dependent oxidoreductase (nitroreductase family)